MRAEDSREKMFERRCGGGQNGDFSVLSVTHIGTFRNPAKVIAQA